MVKLNKDFCKLVNEIGMSDCFEPFRTCDIIPRYEVYNFNYVCNDAFTVTVMVENESERAVRVAGEGEDKILPVVEIKQWEGPDKLIGGTILRSSPTIYVYDILSNIELMEARAQEYPLIEKELKGNAS